MKKVHSSRQLMHLFCNMVLSDMEGFRTSSKNIYIQNRIMYSYGSHYPMATKASVHTGNDYTEIIFINSAKSSVTTQKHKSILWGSTKSNQKVLQVPDLLDLSSIDNERHLSNELADAVSDQFTKKSFVLDVNRALNNYNTYLAFLGKPTISIPNDLMEVINELNIERAKKTKEKELKKELLRQERYAKEAEELKSEVALWYDCKNTRYIPSHAFGLSYSVVRINQDKVESNRGAEVSLEQAKQFCAALKENSVNVGDKIGPFEVLKNEDELITIGCHVLNKTQVLKAVLGA